MGIYSVYNTHFFEVAYERNLDYEILGLPINKFLEELKSMKECLDTIMERMGMLMDAIPYAMCGLGKFLITVCITTR